MLNNSLLHPESIAIIGASRNPGKPGGRLVINMVDSGYSGKIYPVNPKESEICGLQVYTSINELPDTDLAILAISPDLCVEAVDYMSKSKATSSFIIISAGFSELGSEGKVLEDRLKALAVDRQLSIVGPNCIGVLNNHYKAIFVSPLPPVVEGGVDFVSASGALAVFLFEMTAKYGMKFGSVFTVGNSTSIGVEEILEYWDETFELGISGLVKMVYAEQIRKPASFFKHVQSLRLKGCNVLVLKPGETTAGARAALSHTGAFAGDAQAYSILIQKAGAIRCFSREEMVYTANILSQKPLQGRRLAIITHAGGPGVMLADQLQKSGIEVPQFSLADKQAILEKLFKGASATNPIDMMATANKDQLKFAVEYCEQLATVDGIVVIYGKTGMEDLFETYRCLHDTVQSCKKPVYAILPSIHSGVDEIQSFIDSGHQVYTDEVIFGRCLSALLNVPKCSSAEYLVHAPLNASIVQRVLPDEEVFERLASIGLPVEAPKIYSSVDDFKIEDDIEFPVVAKTLGVLHKTEVGGVRVNLKNPEELISAVNALISIEGSKGVMVQKMVAGVELYLGGKRHDGVGFSVHLGLGGIFVELVKDVASTLAPVSEQEALEMIESLKGQALFTGFRNQQPIDKKVFARIVQTFSKLFEKFPDIKEVDINPLKAKGTEMRIVDARMIVDIKNNEL